MSKQTETAAALATLDPQAREQPGKRPPPKAEDAAVSPERAAELLHISRPTLLKKLAAGELPFHYVGAQRRITLADLLEYKRQRQIKGQAALQQMVELAEEMGLYDAE